MLGPGHDRGCVDGGCAAVGVDDLGHERPSYDEPGAAIVDGHEQRERGGGGEPAHGEDGHDVGDRIPPLQRRPQCDDVEGTGAVVDDDAGAICCDGQQSVGHQSDGGGLVGQGAHASPRFRRGAVSSGTIGVSRVALTSCTAVAPLTSRTMTETLS